MVEESKSERIATPVTVTKVSLLNDVFYHAVITDTPSNLYLNDFISPPFKRILYSDVCGNVVQFCRGLHGYHF